MRVIRPPRRDGALSTRRRCKPSSIVYGAGGQFFFNRVFVYNVEGKKGAPALCALDALCYYYKSVILYYRSTVVHFTP